MDTFERGPRAGYARQRAAGFTLVELMVTIVVAAILLGVAVPSFQVTINNGRLATASNELLVSLQTARIEAIRYNDHTMVCLSKTANTATPTCAAAGATDSTGWITFVDVNHNNAYNAGTDRLLRRSTVPDKITVLASSNIPQGIRVVYLPDGYARNLLGTSLLTGTFDLCMQTKRPPENVRRVAIGTGSRIGITRVAVANGACNTPPNS
ncbi:GspH/FimT family pseudopilin [Lysobacter sp. KIS68-7]|uniref:GspH/FimT family pseudopilin n=1 Tax=Lysobacter sp. KIS68-7 TaxID=2904252 RepID=UPI001E50BE7B|nr:GspH/FimT family pseudopilin [Lysobacter sp. KIS68-7]UHQ19279.1 GspH/FimT family pseudopilin [Lysobacter sp. KIS68-7]